MASLVAEVWAEHKNNLKRRLIRPAAPDLRTFASWPKMAHVDHAHRETPSQGHRSRDTLVHIGYTLKELVFGPIGTGPDPVERATPGKCDRKPKGGRFGSRVSHSSRPSIARQRLSYAVE